MLINLIPDFLAVLHAADRAAAYSRYFDSHRPILDAYWRNYVVDPEGPHFAEVVRSTVTADRRDLLATLKRLNVVSRARKAESRCAGCSSGYRRRYRAHGRRRRRERGGARRRRARDRLRLPRALHQHPKSRNAGLGLDPELIPLWLSHEIAHGVRYTSPTSRAELRQLVAEQNGFYSYWETARRASLRELVINEGLAVQVSEAVSPGHAAWEYFGYARRQYARIRELEAVIARQWRATSIARGSGSASSTSRGDER